MFSPTNLKSHFAIFKTHPELVYLDNASTTQTPDSVVAAMDEYYQNFRSNTHRGLYAISEKATAMYELAREKTAQFIKAQPEEIIFTRNATHALNILAHGLVQKLQPGDEIVLTEMEHHSNLVPWQQLAKKHNVTIKFIPVTDEGLLELHDLTNIITRKTKIVSCTHASNVLGTINPIKTIIALAHQVGALTIIDACQSIPHEKIDVGDIDADFLAFSAHKLCGPTGVGILFGKKELLDQLEPFEYGGHMIEEVTFTQTTFADSPARFEAGTANIAGVIGFAAAIDFLEQLDWQEIKKYEQNLTRYTLDQLSLIPEITIHGLRQNSARTGVVSLSIKDVHSHDVAHILGMHHIAVRAGHHCAQPLLQKLGIKDSVRASLYFYNTEEDINALIIGLKKVISTFFSEKSKI